MTSFFSNMMSPKVTTKLEADEEKQTGSQLKNNNKIEDEKIASISQEYSESQNEKSELPTKSKKFVPKKEDEKPEKTFEFVESVLKTSSSENIIGNNETDTVVLVKNTNKVSLKRGAEKVSTAKKSLEEDFYQAQAEAFEAADKNEKSVLIQNEINEKVVEQSLKMKTHSEEMQTKFTAFLETLEKVENKILQNGSQVEKAATAIPKLGKAEQEISISSPAKKDSEAIFIDKKINVANQATSDAGNVTSEKLEQEIASSPTFMETKFVTRKFTPNREMNKEDKPKPNNHSQEAKSETEPPILPENLVNSEAKDLLQLPKTSTKFYEINEKNLRSGCLFEDPHFSYDVALFDFVKNTLQDDTRQETEKELQERTKAFLKSSYFKWMRPREITPNAKFFNSSAILDTDEDLLVDDTFLSSVISLSTNEELLKKVVQADQTFEKNYSGMFYFRLWRYGEWHDVVIDDKIPVRSQNCESRLPAPNKGHQNFWIPLLEKAYSKLNGGYKAAEGFSHETMVSLTGGICERHRLNLLTTSNDFFQTILAAYENNCPMTASTKHTSDKGSFYSVTAAATIQFSVDGKTKTAELIKVRTSFKSQPNWSQIWSNGSRQWDLVYESEKKRLNITNEADRNGEFWISYQDFVNLFSEIQILRTTTGTKETWATKTFEGVFGLDCNSAELKFEDDKTEMTKKVPVYRFFVPQPSAQAGSKQRVVVGIRRQSSETDSKIGFSLFRLEGSKLQEEVDEVSGDTIEETGTYELRAGQYAVVPHTDSNRNTQFMIRIFIQK